MNYLTTCEICGRAETGVTNLLEDCFIECESGHLICTNHIEEEYPLDFIKQEIINKIKLLSDYENYPEENFSFIKSKTLYEILSSEEIPNNFQIPISICPVCNFKSISNLELRRYKEIILRKSDRELKEEIFRKYKTYNEFKEFLNRE